MITRDLLNMYQIAILTGEGLPERMAPLNSMLDLLPASVRDELLTAYVNMTS